AVREHPQSEQPAWPSGAFTAAYLSKWGPSLNRLCVLLINVSTRSGRARRYNHLAVKKRLRGIGMSNGNDRAGISRRHLLRNSVAVSAAASAGAQTTGAGILKPNVVVVIADEVRWDAIGAYGRNPMDLTPNLNAMAG